MVVSVAAISLRRKSNGAVVTGTIRADRVELVIRFSSCMKEDVSVRLA